MDRPKLEVSWLECFPPDIWAYIVWYLPGEQLGRLLMTGAMLLWYRLKSPHVVKSIKLGEDVILFKSLPRFLNELPSLDELLIHSCSDEWSRSIGLTVESIPSGVRKLELGGKWRPQPKFFVKGSNLSKHLPHLTSLDIMGLYDSEHSWMVHSPQSLTFLSLLSWNGSVALPSSLIHFTANYVRLSTHSFVSTLPHSLESFVALGELIEVDLLVPLLPPSTHKLHLGRSVHHSYQRTTSFRAIFEQLPKFLTYFAFPKSNGINFKTNPELISVLPTTLTELEIGPDLPYSVWHLLPPNLTKLSFDARDPLTAVKVVNGIEAECVLESIPFDLLPRSLTKLEMRDCLDRFCGPPSTTSNQSYFPPNLTYLKLPYSLHLSPQVVKHLPSSLAHLEISNLCEQVCQYLPTGLKTLISYGTLMSSKLIELPKSLTFLKLDLCRPSHPWFDYNTGQKVDSVSTLPEYSIHKKCLSNNFDWKQTFPLPSTLTYLEISGHKYHFNEFGDMFLQHQQLPNLLELRVSSKCFTDLSIPLLPRHLTTLDLYCSTMVSGKSFKSLPRCLIQLNLNCSKSIFDSEIQHLPRTLKRLCIDNAIHLTELCIADLPPHLEYLDMQQNSKISSSCFTSFPYSLRSHMFCATVSFNKWNAHSGVIRE